MCDADCIAFAEELGVISVNVEYRLAPEHPFPTPVNDAWDALQWVRVLPLGWQSFLDCGIVNK